MYDRVAQNTGRVLVTPENGIEPFYATLTLADNPVTAGTPLNKSTLLTDAVAALYGKNAAATPNDILKVLANAALYDGNTLKLPNGGAVSAGNSVYVTGTYIGDGSEYKTINLGFQPKAVLVVNDSGAMQNSIMNYTQFYGGLALDGNQCVARDVNTKPVITVLTNGFRVYFAQVWGDTHVMTNYLNQAFFYIAFK